MANKLCCCCFSYLHRIYTSFAQLVSCATLASYSMKSWHWSNTSAKWPAFYHIRLVKGLGPWDHVSSALRDLHWLPIQQRIIYKLCVLMYQIHTGRSPSYMSSLVIATADISSRAGLRSASTNRYEPHTTRLKFGERCFSHAGPKAWNTLPVDIQDLTDETSFKRRLKTFLFQQAYTVQKLVACRWSPKCKMNLNLQTDLHTRNSSVDDIGEDELNRLNHAMVLKLYHPLPPRNRGESRIATFSAHHD